MLLDDNVWALVGALMVFVFTMSIAIIEWICWVIAEDKRKKK